MICRRPAKARNAELAKRFIALATSPEVQAEGIVKRFNWYPGIDANVVKPALDPKVWNSLFVDVTPADLAKNGKPFLFPGDAGIVGIASDVAVETALPTAHLDDIPAVAAMLLTSAISLDGLLSMAIAES